MKRHAQNGGHTSCEQERKAMKPTIKFKSSRAILGLGLVLFLACDGERTADGARQAKIKAIREQVARAQAESDRRVPEREAAARAAERQADLALYQPRLAHGFK